MLTVQEKTEQNAEKRLTLPAGRKPSEELARYKNFLKVENHRLKILHRGGASGREVCNARANVFDVLIRYILDSLLAGNPTLSNVDSVSWSLVATGGYGRAELNPLSDIDIMFLFQGEVVRRGKPHPYLTALNEGLLLTLWDIGLKVGHSVRSVYDCVQLANQDMQSKTSLIEARLITGNSELFKIFQENINEKCVVGHEDEYIKTRIEDQANRREKNGNSPLMLEPNIKNGCGGLRDYQNLLWMTFFKYGTRSLKAVIKQELLSVSERRQLRTAYDFLLRVRNEMHTHFTKATPAIDRLTKNLQPKVAYALGYTNRSQSQRLEEFMKDLYVHMRLIYLITRVLEQRIALAKIEGGFSRFTKMLRLPGLKTAVQTRDGFQFTEKYIRHANQRVFKDQPRRLMRVFLHAQKRGLQFHPDLRQLIRNSLSLVDREFLRDPHVRDTFLEILNQRGSVAGTLRAMHEMDFLGKYIPEFGRLTCLVQHEFFHVYSADEHILMCLEQLDRVWESDAPPYSSYTEIFQEIDRPYIIYLALLLHDAAKGLTKKKKHEEEGAELARRIAGRMKLDAGTTHLLQLLIEHHILMALVSQRRDLEDPDVINSFCETVQSVPALHMLTLHTFADGMGTSEKLWNSFKNQLLLSLYRKSLRNIAGGTTFIRARVEQREHLRKSVRKHLSNAIKDDELEAHFDNLPPRYFRLHSHSEIAKDVTMAHRFYRLLQKKEEHALNPIVRWRNEPDRGYTALKVCTWDRAGLFTKIAGSLSAVGLNILSAQVFSRRDGVALDEFFVTRADGASMVTREERNELEALLARGLNGQEVDFAKRVAGGAPKRDSVAVEEDALTPRVYFDNEGSQDFTIIDVEAPDRHGLLYAISNAFTELKLNLALAKILTEKGAAVDSFYVNQIEDGKITDPALQQEIGARILRVVKSLG